MAVRLLPEIVISRTAAVVLRARTFCSAVPWRMRYSACRHDLLL